MHFYHLSELLFFYLFTKLLESKMQLFLRNFSNITSVQLVKDCLNSLRFDNLPQIDCGCNKLTVIYSIIVFVNFFDHWVDFYIGNLNMGFLNSIHHFLFANNSCTIYVNSLEKVCQLCNFLFCRHFYQHVHAYSFQMRNTFVFFKSRDYIHIKCVYLLVNILMRRKLSEPGML